MTVRPFLALLVAVPLLAAPTLAQMAEQGCAEELEQLTQSVEPAELGAKQRSEYEDLLEAAITFRDNGAEVDCLTTIGTIRRHLFVYPHTTGNDQGLADTSD